MLYLDYSRKAGEWVPNVFGGRENLEAIAFLRRLNDEVTALPGSADDRRGIDGLADGLAVRRASGGLGFDMKWDMGWMNDTLDYMSSATRSIASSTTTS